MVRECGMIRRGALGCAETSGRLLRRLAKQGQHGPAPHLPQDFTPYPRPPYAGHYAARWRVCCDCRFAHRPMRLRASPRPQPPARTRERADELPCLFSPRAQHARKIATANKWEPLPRGLPDVRAGRLKPVAPPVSPRTPGSVSPPPSPSPSPTRSPAGHPSAAPGTPRAMPRAGRASRSSPSPGRWLHRLVHRVRRNLHRARKKSQFSPQKSKKVRFLLRPFLIASRPRDGLFFIWLG